MSGNEETLRKFSAQVMILKTIALVGPDGWTTSEETNQCNTPGKDC